MVSAMTSAPYPDDEVLEATNPQLGDHALGSDRERALDSASAGAGMTAAAEGLGDLGHVDGTFAAQADAEAPSGCSRKNSATSIPSIASA